MRIKLQIDHNAFISIDMEDILMVHENTRKSLCNAHTKHGEIVVFENSILPMLSGAGFIVAYTRFNSSTAANAAGVKTSWEDGERFRVWYSPTLPVAQIGQTLALLVNGKMFRIEK